MKWECVSFSNQDQVSDYSGIHSNRSVEPIGNREALGPRVRDVNCFGNVGGVTPGVFHAISAIFITDAVGPRLKSNARHAHSPVRGGIVLSQSDAGWLATSSETVQQFACQGAM